MATFPILSGERTPSIINLAPKPQEEEIPRGLSTQKEEKILHPPQRTLASTNIRDLFVPHPRRSPRFSISPPTTRHDKRRRFPAHLDVILHRPISEEAFLFFQTGSLVPPRLHDSLFHSPTALTQHDEEIPRFHPEQPCEFSPRYFGYSSVLSLSQGRSGLGTTRFSQSDHATTKALRNSRNI
ncbi:hypothetical protein Sjap_011868 [Stephania japonica]|uniref:Uncharacterized protein n=1 Tax=Stephania japonica TaxID=461633 RepID=A0AAP0P8G1_9MAGN